MKLIPLDDETRLLDIQEVVQITVHQVLVTRQDELTYDQLHSLSTYSTLFRTNTNSQCDILLNLSHLYIAKSVHSLHCTHLRSVCDLTSQSHDLHQVIIHL